MRNLSSAQKDGPEGNRIGDDEAPNVSKVMVLHRLVVK